MTNRNLTRLLVLGAALAAAAGLLTGCNEEGERPLHFDKGKYVGPQDAPLSPEQSDALKQRMNNQRY